MPSCLYIYRGSPIGSAKIHIDSIISELEKLACDVHRYIPYAWEDRGGGASRYVPKLLGASPLLLRNVAQYFVSGSFGRGLNGAVEKWSPDFLYERYALFNSAGIEAGKRDGLPHILEVNSVIHSLDQNFIVSPLRSIAQKSEPKIFQRTDHVIAISKRIREELLGMDVEETRISVMHNGVDAMLFHKDPGQAEIFRTELGYDRDDFVVVASMGFNHRYIVDAVTDMLIGSLKKIVKGKKGLKVLFIGGGKELIRAKSRIIPELEPGSVHFTGNIPYEMVPRFLSVGDLAYIPWHVEFSSPLKLFEYMSMELPIIVPRLPGILEVFDEAFGWSFEHQNVQEAEQVLVHAMSFKEGLIEMGRNARREVLNHYTWASNARRVLEIARSLSKD